MTTKSTMQHSLSNPTAWNVTQPNAADGQRLSSVSGMTFGAPMAVAASESVQGATEGGATATTPASSGRQGNGGQSASLSMSPDRVAILLPVPNVSRPCEQCRRSFTPRRPWGRFCSSYCRRLSWLGRNPEKAAELAERDRARLRAHIIGNDGEWVERARVS
jgi:hypothetical protein